MIVGATPWMKMIVLVTRKLDSKPRRKIHLAYLKPTSALFQIFAATIDECLSRQGKGHYDQQNYEKNDPQSHVISYLPS
jgi:hypothetical protein